MGNEYRDYQRWVLINGRLGFDMTHVTDFNLQATAPNPATGVTESCVEITFDVAQDDSTELNVITWRVRHLFYFGTDAAALRSFIPAYCMKANAPKPS